MNECSRIDAVLRMSVYPQSIGELSYVFMVTYADGKMNYAVKNVV